MARYIDADAMKASIESTDTDEKKVLSTKELHEVLNDWIDRRPTADVRENIHGKWVENGEYLGELRFKCSVCQKDMAVSTVILKPIWNFCPNCGARMEQSEE